MTYSIVARDPDTGELGVAVQSHWFSVGPIVPWARPGVGAVATQANVAVAYGPRALDALEQGEAPADALARLLAADPQRASRQVAIVSARGEGTPFGCFGCGAEGLQLVGPHFGGPATALFVGEPEAVGAEDGVVRDDHFGILVGL